MKIVKLKDLTIDGKGTYGIAAPAVDWQENLPTYLRITDIFDDGTLNFSGLKSVSDSNAGKYFLKPNDIVFARTGGSTGRSYFYDGTDGKFVYAGFLIKFSLDSKKVNPKYIKYFCLSESYKKWVHSFNTGSTRGNINAQTFGNLEIPLLERPQQDKIVSFLDSIDQKIKINKKTNDNLYAQAKATTKQWISKSTGDYELLPLSDIASINPDTYSPKETWKYVNYLDTSSITEGCIAEIQHITPSSEKLPSRARRKIAPNDIVFSTVRPNQRHYGIISEPLPNMLGSTGFAVIRSKNPLVCNELIYLCLTENEFIEKMQQLAEQSTSTFPSIKPSDLGVCEIPCPKDQSSTSFTETLKSLFALIAANQRENISLSEIRDALLPKLMSGEIDVSDIQL